DGEGLPVGAECHLGTGAAMVEQRPYDLPLRDVPQVHVLVVRHREQAKVGAETALADASSLELEGCRFFEFRLQAPDGRRVQTGAQRFAVPRDEQGVVPSWLVVRRLSPNLEGISVEQERAAIHQSRQALSIGEEVEAGTTTEGFVLHPRLDKRLASPD